MFRKKEMSRVSLVMMFLVFAGVNFSFGAVGGNDFVVEEDTSGISVSDGVIQLKFFDAESGFGLYSLSNVQTGYDFLAGNAKQENLWRIKFRNAFNQFMTIDNTVNCTRTYKTERASDGSSVTLHLLWKGIVMGGEADALDVQASMRLDKSGLSYWKINVNNKSKQFGKWRKGYGAWEVTYPAVRGLKASKDDNMQLAYPLFLGHLVKDITNRSILMIYPSHRAKMQFSTLFGTENKSGLYLAAHDSGAYEKKFLYEPDQKDKSLKYEIKNYPDGMGQSANGYKMPYEAVVGVYEGDWITASKIYRKWAVRQKWCSKGKLSERNDIPKWFTDITVWFSGLPTDKMIPLAKYLDTPIAYHWYGWYKMPSGGFGDPDYFEFIPQVRSNDNAYFPNQTDSFSEKIKELHGTDIKLMPYINSRYWATSAKSWNTEHPEPYVCKGPFNLLEDLTYYTWADTWKELAMYMEHWGFNNQAIMCPYTKFWQNKQSQVIDRLVSEYDVDGVYMDQTASYYPVLCFDPGHGHTLGGGNYWSEGNRKLIEICKENSRKIKKEAILTSEGHAEPFLDLFDGHLACNSSSIAPELIPMFHYVYSGYCITFGRMTGRHWDHWDGDIYSRGLPLMMRNAQMFAWGEQMGWFNPNVVDLPSREAEYIKTLCKALEKGPVKKFLIYGEMLRPPRLRGDNPVLAKKWRKAQKETEMPAVLHSAWKADDGTFGLVFTNMDATAHTVSYTVDTKRYQLPKAGRYSVKVVAGQDEGKVKSYNSASFFRTEKMPARSVLVLEVSPL